VTLSGQHGNCDDLHRETEPKFVGDFGLPGSVCAGLTGRFAVSVAQLSASSNGVEELSFFPKIPAVVVRWESGKRVAFSQAASPPSMCARHVRQFEGASPLSNLMEVKD
jgi:hypothetical protein